MTVFRLLRLLVVLGLAGAVARAARAGDMRFPADGSGVLLTLPENWTTAEDADGSLRCRSGDGEFYFDLFPSKVLRGSAANLPEVAQDLAKAAGLEEVRTQDGGEKANPHGAIIAGIIVLGKKGDADYAGVVSVIKPTEGDLCAFQCFGTKSVLLVHSREMKVITDSFRSVK